MGTSKNHSRYATKRSNCCETTRSKNGDGEIGQQRKELDKLLAKEVTELKKNLKRPAESTDHDSGVEASGGEEAEEDEPQAVEERAKKRPKKAEVPEGQKRDTPCSQWLDGTMNRWHGLLS